MWLLSGHDMTSQTRKIFSLSAALSILPTAHFMELTAFRIVSEIIGIVLCRSGQTYRTGTHTLK